MTPHISWAFKQRDLTAAQRLVLIALCERANGDRICFPSFSLIATDCELTRRIAIKAVKYLSETRRLISKITDPAERLRLLKAAGGRDNSRANIYRINRPDDAIHGEQKTPSAKANGEQKTPSNSELCSPSNGEQKTPRRPPDGEPRAPMMVKKSAADGELSSPEPLNEINTEPLARVRGGDEGAAAAAPDGRSGGALPPQTPKAPTLGGTTNGSGRPANAMVPPGQKPPDPFADGVDEAKAWMGRQLGRTVHLATPEPEALTGDVLEPDDTVGANATMAVARGLGRSMRHFALAGVGPQRTVEQQIEAIINPLQAQEPERSPAQQIAELMGISLAEAEAQLNAPMAVAAE